VTPPRSPLVVSSPGGAGLHAVLALPEEVGLAADTLVAVSACAGVAGRVARLTPVPPRVLVVAVGALVHAGAICKGNAHTGTHTHTHTHTHAHRRARTHTQSRGCRQAGTHTHTITYIHTHTRIYIQARMHAHTHTHTHTHTQACRHTHAHTHTQRDYSTQLQPGTLWPCKQEW